MELDLTLAVGLVVTAVLVSLSSLFAVSAFLHGRSQPVSSIFTEATPDTVFLFDGASLLDATPQARAMLAKAEGTADAWFRTIELLEPMFPSLSTRLEGLPREGCFVLCSREDLEPPLVLRAECLGGLTRITLMTTDAELRQSTNEGAADIALRHELVQMREIVARAPAIVWRVRKDGQVIWANGAYLLLAAETLAPGQDLSWPLPQIFDAPEPDGATPSRRSVRIGETVRWYEVTGVASGDEIMAYALPADRLAQSEATLRDFMQTLTKTFAQLPIGLAIFDRNRVLQLFNPSLLDLTGLEPTFLIARPTLNAFLDAMREHSMIPEPKDYRTWRRQIVALEEAAASGHFEETWTLPSGQTYRVTGRPHPNGALAFLFEDISNEMMRTRRYRADLELGQAVIDAMDTAVAVFSRDGTLVMTNKAYSGLWGHSADDAAIADVNRASVIGRWRTLSAPTLLWNDLSDFVGTLGERDAWDGELRLLDGRYLGCKVMPIAHGATLVAFSLLQPRLTLVHDEDSPPQAVLIA
jgi:PAS domain-containing protein